MNESERGRAPHAGGATQSEVASGEVTPGPAVPDEAARLWSQLEKKQSVREGNSRLWLGMAMTVGLAVVLIGLWIVVVY